MRRFNMTNSGKRPPRVTIRHNTVWRLTNEIAGYGCVGNGRWVLHVVLDMGVSGTTRSKRLQQNGQENRQEGGQES